MQIKQTETECDRTAQEKPTIRLENRGRCQVTAELLRVLQVYIMLVECSVQQKANEIMPDR